MHAVLDDAPHYMRTHNLNGFYRSMKHMMTLQPQPDGSTGVYADEIQRATAVANATVNGNSNGIINGNVNGSANENHGTTSTPQLLIWSAADESATRRMLQAYGQYYSSRIAGHPHKLSQLAYTLAARRSILPWRSFAVVEESDSIPGPEDKDEGFHESGRTLSTEKPLRVHSGKADVAFVFTGQGAQYAGMGLELMRYPVFSHSLRRSDEVFESLGCGWSLFGELMLKPPRAYIASSPSSTR